MKQPKTKHIVIILSLLMTSMCCFCLSVLTLFLLIDKKYVVLNMRLPARELYVVCYLIVGIGAYILLLWYIFKLDKES